MTTNENAYAVLALCEADPDFSNRSVWTDVGGHAAILMGHSEPDYPTWSKIRDFLGFDIFEGDELWWYSHEDIGKDATLKKFAAMILRIHGPSKDGVPAALRLI